jgi:hypothetical protein
MQLTADTRLAWSAPRWNPAEHLQLSSGVHVVRPALLTLEQLSAASRAVASPKTHGCYRPMADWRALTAAELALVLGISADGLGRTVQVFEIPQEMVLAGRKAAQDSVAAGTAERRSRGAWQIRGQALGTLAECMDRWMAEEVCVDFMHGCDYGPFIRINPPGRTSTTGYLGDGWDGLHVDNWGGSVWLQRQRTYQGSRFVLNLGTETRHFIYVNLKLTTMLHLLEQRAPEAITSLLGQPQYTAVGLTASAFLENFPDYPVLRIALPSGHGYVANSCELAHDGFIPGLAGDDIALLIPHKVHSIVGSQASLAVRPPQYRDSWTRALKF